MLERRTVPSRRFPQKGNCQLSIVVSVELVQVAGKGTLGHLPVLKELAVV
jgi:hypothetical protein